MRQITIRAMAMTLVTAVAAAGCAHHQSAKTASVAAPEEAIEMPAKNLWSQEAAADPITSYRVKLATDPDNAGLHNNLGNEYVLSNQMDDALAEFRTAARLDRGSAIPWNNMGTTYKKIDQLGKAKDSFERAVRIDQRYALAWYNLGTVYDAQGDYDKAIEQYLRAISLRPELAEVKYNPQVVENKKLMVVKLRHFLEESGNIALPLEKLPE